MKLRNKKTGEIHEITEVVPLHDMDKKFVIYSKTEGHNHAYKNLAEFNEEWEDYEEPKEYWFITGDGFIFERSKETYPEDETKRKQIGNHFETKEEAEKAVEKLKAVKRLKDKGFRFDGYDVANRLGDDVICGQVYFKAGNYDREEIEEDLYLLFGGEE